jgi:hypothetical protein
VLILGIISLACVAVGIILIGIGVYMSLSDWKRKLKETASVTAEGTSGQTLGALAKLAEALRDYPPGMQLIFLGIALMLAGGALGGITTVANT